MHEWAVDLFSDTKTRPSLAMREAMAGAVVGDEQQDEDPTVARLNERVADLLGKERALFLPSGTMANVASTLVHCGRGDEILCEATSHVIHLETGGPAGIAGATVTPLVGHRGIFSLDTLEEAIRTPRRNAPRPRLIWIEQTTNLGGGAVWPLDQLRSLRPIANLHRMAIHIDGARLLNAAIAHHVDTRSYGHVADSLWIDFTKGLGAPFGAVLAGSSEFIDQARRFKHMLGGAMRQAGIMAAACLYALDHNVDRLSEDHARARLLADHLAAIAGVNVERPVETNIVVCHLPGAGNSAQRFAEAMRADGVRVGVFGRATIRIVTHADVSPSGLDHALEAITRAALVSA